MRRESPSRSGVSAAAYDHERAARRMCAAVGTHIAEHLAREAMFRSGSLRVLAPPVRLQPSKGYAGTGPSACARVSVYRAFDCFPPARPFARLRFLSFAAPGGVRNDQPETCWDGEEGAMRSPVQIWRLYERLGAGSAKTQTSHKLRFSAALAAR